MVTKVHPHVCEEHHCLCLLFTPSTVHPHVCRKHIVSTLALTIGSSLRMRETHHRCRASVHPRVCGKHNSLWSSIRLPAGPSPRVWRTHLSSVLILFGRSIPACVENTPILGVPILHYYYPMYSRYPAKVGTLPYVKDPCSLHTRDISRFNARVTPRLHAHTPANLPVFISIYTIHTV